MQKLEPATNLVHELKEQMPTVHQKASFESIAALFLEATGAIRLRKSKGKSAGSLSRYLNHYLWSTKKLWERLDDIN